MKHDTPCPPAVIPPLTRLGELAVEDFLRDYWQQQPLLVRQAFPGFELPLSADELAGLACDTDTARLVLERGGRHPWELRSGPIAEDAFAGLPETHWTLLVNDCEKMVPELQAIVQPFRFIPDWRIDDLMISYAAPGGSVGPHVDAYDVFLLQAQGRRRWQISSQPCTPDNFIPDLDLRVMQAFSPEQEWVLEPGDLLYLPPGVPHYGVAMGECMTCSIGFRAPSQAELLERLLGHLVEQPALAR
ncbi:MAG TPA: cupin domain-containing protein, partial [Thiolinea sp.]|nr:cupin domain-containing protein [Thiolinea sp.]